MKQSKLFLESILYKLPSIVVAAILISACGQEANSKEGQEMEIKQALKTVETKGDKEKNALAFINGYTETTINMTEQNGQSKWVNASPLATKEFKAVYNKIMEDAFKADPEYGLGADPILDAQDFPSKGFELESFDDATNFLIIRGKDWPDFKLTMKVKQENGKWMVDGCGIVNIPVEEQSDR